ncbi:MAG: energy transducer TonB [Candidatus Solibacter sp.]|jgi:TonB family protein
MRLSALAFLLIAGCCFAQDAWQVQRLVALTKYPMLPRMAFIQGTVELRCSIADDGAVSECHVSSGHPLLNSAAIENLKLWTLRRGPETKAATSEVTMIYSFELSGAAVRGDPRTEFSFEFPNHVKFISQPACADHVPCTPEEKQQWQENVKKRNRL